VKQFEANSLSCFKKDAVGDGRLRPGAAPGDLNTLSDVRLVLPPGELAEKRGEF